MRSSFYDYGDGDGEASSKNEWIRKRQRKNEANEKSNERKTARS